LSWEHWAWIADGFMIVIFLLTRHNVSDLLAFVNVFIYERWDFLIRKFRSLERILLLLERMGKIKQERTCSTDTSSPIWFTHSSENTTFMMYDKDFMNLYCTSCTLFKSLYYTYNNGNIEKKVDYWRIWWLGNEDLCYTKMYLLI